MAVNIPRFTEQKIKRLIDGSDRIARACAKMQVGKILPDAARNLDLVINCYLAAEAPWVVMSQDIAVSAICNEMTIDHATMMRGGYAILCQVDLRPIDKVYRWTLTDEPGPVLIRTDEGAAPVTPLSFDCGPGPLVASISRGPESPIIINPPMSMFE